ncbi:hypothetical protein CSV61_11465 [Sporosarcina sp. P3]|uniref:hypothetical protein n=1 Tax=Sporosarcina sp. P3 TaxID=2048245 RepID=UPI000C16BB66|nr:hypothetical protein [Sporosarcina sp. P3]PID21096.1 hypothetical protein CSV61_11465 [Sporosarcina sp. P3]
MNLKLFLITFVLAYILISLPAMLGIGSVIDWVPEATWYQKFKGYVVDGLLNKFFIKIIIASTLGIIVSLINSKRQYSK